MDRIWIEGADGDDLFHLDDADLAAGGGGHVEVSRRLAEHDVAGFVRLPRLDDGQVGEDSFLQDVVLTPEALHFLALGHLRADAGLGVEAGDARPARAAALGERPLRAELDLQLARQILALELLVLADVARDHLGDLPRAEQLAEPFAVDPGIVRRDRQPRRPCVADRVDQPLGDAAQPEATRANCHAVVEQPVERRGRIGVDLSHRRASPWSAQADKAVRPRGQDPRGHLATPSSRRRHTGDTNRLLRRPAQGDRVGEFRR